MPTCSIVVLAEPHPRWTALCRAVQLLPEVRLLDRVRRVTDALDRVPRLRPELLIASLDLPGEPVMSGLVPGEPVMACLTVVHHQCPQLRFLLLSRAAPRTDLRPLIGRPLAGYLRWSAVTPALLQA